MDADRRDAGTSLLRRTIDTLTLTDLLACPVVHQLMRADRIGPEHILDAVEQARGRRALKELVA